MLAQVVYETNADWYASQEAMVKNDLVRVDVTQKGLLWFKFKKNRTVFLLSPLGKLQVRWNDESEKRTLFRLIKELLVAKPNEKLLVRPLKQQTWIEYPEPPSFKVYWCDNATEFVVKTTLEKDSSVQGRVASKTDQPMTNEEEVVRKALEELRLEFRFFREPTFKEVALRSGCLDSRIIRRSLMLGNWKAQSAEEAKRAAEEAINLAGLLHFKEKGELNLRLLSLCNEVIDASLTSDIARAQAILKNFPSLVPEINVHELTWSDEAKARWIQIFGCNPPSSRYLGLTLEDIEEAFKGGSFSYSFSPGGFFPDGK